MSKDKVSFSFGNNFIFVFKVSMNKTFFSVNLDSRTSGQMFLERMEYTDTLGTNVLFAEIK